MSGGGSMGEDAWAEPSGEYSVFADSAGGTKISVSQPWADRASLRLATAGATCGFVKVFLSFSSAV